VNTPLTDVDIEECSGLGSFITVTVQNGKEVSRIESTLWISLGARVVGYSYPVFTETKTLLHPFRESTSLSVVMHKCQSN
jgi:hypothetical protein